MSAPQLTRYASGSGQVSGDQLNTFLQGCLSVTQLRLLVGTVGMSIFIAGYSSAGDGGAGTFYWNATATGPDDGKTVIVPQSGVAGAWIRLTGAGTSGSSTSGTSWGLDNSTTANTINLPISGYGTPADGSTVNFRAANTNTGAVTMTINSSASAPLYQNGAALTGGEIIASADYAALYDASAWHLIGSGKGAVNAATAVGGTQVVNLTQMEDYTGNTAVDYQVKGGTGSNSAVTYAQLSAASGGSGGTGVIGAGSTNHYVVGSRAVGTTYANGNPGPMFVSVYVSLSEGGEVYLSVDGNTVSDQASPVSPGGGTYHQTLHAWVPPGSTYVVKTVSNVSVALAAWTEFY